ncbi:MAG: sulfotransferase domain-containing protein [Anaerolineales bacterium]|nr:sulfotransferase domain-containing protein [Anaerolineales bacterium]
MNPRDYLDRLQYHTQRITARLRFGNSKSPEGGGAVLMGISFPKSGTNLLRQVLAAFARVAPYADRSYDVFAVFDARTGVPNDAQAAMHFLDKLHPGDIAAAHFHAWPNVMDRVCQKPYIPFFIYRDPRDVVVSHVFYVTKMAPEHVHHRYYAEVLKTFEERLTTSILGRPEVDVDFPDIGKRFEPYIGWLERSEVLSQRFEDYILDQPKALAQVIEHYEKFLPLPVPRDQMLAAFQQSILPEKSPTFRSGKTGEWRKHFQEEHKALFKEVAGDLLIRLGYEKDLSW